MARIVLYTRAGCHLCEEVEAVLSRVGGRLAFDLERIDISSDPELSARYAWDIPVVHIDGQFFCKHRIDEAALIARLDEGTNRR